MPSTEMGCEDQYNHTFLAGGASMGIHEPKPVFENIISRSEPFLTYIRSWSSYSPRQLEAWMPICSGKQSTKPVPPSSGPRQMS